jgi:hypothetical protein
MRTLGVYTVRQLRKILYFPVEMNWGSVEFMRFIIRIDAPLRTYLLRGRYDKHEV